ncbi:MAG: hypothetical protein AB3N13_03485 [Arenibacterium sp.]
MRGDISLAIMATTIGLSACSAAHVGADDAELVNLWTYYEVPKSTPRQLVQSFDRYCNNRQGSVAADDRRLRADGYVPLSKRKGAQAYVIDNNLPAVAVSEQMCITHAKSRTGQTTAFQSYVARTFPDARALDPDTLGRRIEQAWQISGSRILATQRGADLGWYTYSLILFQAEGA